MAALHWPPLLVVGLTGGIACGKSTVARMFGELGATLINADHVGRDVVAPGEPALAEVIRAFGPEYLLPDGTLNRRELGNRVFSSPADLSTLNRITHPRIEARLRARLQSHARRAPNPPIVVMEAAILIEAGWNALADRVIVVTAQPSVQTARLMAGFGWTPPQAEARLRSQLPQNTRLRFADHRIEGDAPLDQVRRQVEALWDQLCIQTGNSASP
jgi:dephospho-CoA kinase